MNKMIKKILGGENTMENSLAKCQAKMLTLFGLRYKTHGLHKKESRQKKGRHCWAKKLTNQVFLLRIFLVHNELRNVCV